MDTQTHRVTNRTRGTLLSEGACRVDATFEHLTILRVLIEGLAGNQEAGLWLTDVRGIPVVPRISPLDLIYLDAQNRVVSAAELLPSAEQPVFRAPAVSALVLPFQTISTTQTGVGDQLAIAENSAGMTGEQAEPEVVEAAVEPGEDGAASPAAAAENAPGPEKAAAEAVAAPGGDRAKAESLEHLRSKKNKGRPRSRRSKKGRAAKSRKETAAVARPLYAATPAALPETKPPALPEPCASAATGGETTSEAKLPALPDSCVLALMGREETPPETKPPAPPAAALGRNEASRRDAPVSPARSAPRRTLAARVKSALGAAFRTTARAERADGNKAGSAVDRVLQWLNPKAYRKEQRNSLRRPTEALVAYGGPAGKRSRFDVADISSSGMYLRTEEKWQPGTPVSLTLQRSGPPDERENRRMDVDADAVRVGRDGVGLAFSFPESMHLDLWETAAKGAATETGPEYIVHEMRMARTMGVIRSICPEVVEETERVLRRKFSNVRVASAMRIVLLAEELLAGEEEGATLRAPASLVARVLDLGSWADTDAAQRMWAGLLATACTADGKGESNANLVELLGQLTPLHLRVLCRVCDRAWEAAADDGTGRLAAQGCSARELMHDLDLANFLKTVRTIGELDNLGLLASAKRSPSDPPETDTRTVATPLGLRLVARGRGWRGEIAAAQTQGKTPAIS